MIGQILRGRYEIDKKLGSGGFGVTYRARDIQLPRKPLCVVKQLNLINFHPNVLPIVRDLFNREAEILSELGHHPQIPRLLDFFEENQQFYLVQEFVEGKVLSDEIKPGKPLSEQQVITILTEVLNILEFVHKKQIIHRDIKPANLIRRQLDEKLVLIDFGAVKEKISTVVHSPQGQQSSSVIGTPGYMPHEQQQGKPQFNSDIYALGITGIQALTGLLPDELPCNPNNQEICRRQGIKVNPKLAVILDKMVRYDFRDRYQSATQVLQALKTVQPQAKSIPWKILIPVGVVAIAAATFFAFLKPNPSESLLLTYDNSTDGIKLKYPADWENQLTVKDPITGDIAKFVTPKESDADKFQEDLTISVEDLSNKPTNLQDFTNFSISEIKQLNPNVNIMAQGETNLANNIPAYQVIYTVKDGQLNLKKMQTWLLKNQQAYTITYTAEADKYDLFENRVKSMLNTLEIK